MEQQKFVRKTGRLFTLIIAGLCLWLSVASCDLFSANKETATTGTVILSNDTSNIPISAFYIRVYGQSDWGSNLLGSELRAGQSFTKKEIEPGTYDVAFATSWMYDSSGYAYYVYGTTTNVTIEAGQRITFKADSGFDSYGYSY